MHILNSTCISPSFNIYKCLFINDGKRSQKLKQTNTLYTILSQSNYKIITLYLIIEKEKQFINMVSNNRV